MTAGTMSRPRRFPWFVFLGVVAGLGWLWLQLPPLNQHAVDGHGRAATTAYTRMAQCDPDTCRPGQYCSCVQEDGRVRHVLKLPKLKGHATTWAIVIVGPLGLKLVTCWLTQSKRQAERKGMGL